MRKSLQKSCMCKKVVLIKRGVVCDGPISKYFCNTINYLCAKFGTFITKCTIVMLCHCTKYDIMLQGKSKAAVWFASERSKINSKALMLFWDTELYLS